MLGYNYNYNYLNEHTGRVTYAQNIADGTLDRSYEYDHVGRLAFSHSGAEARAHAYSGQWGTMDGPYSQGYEYDVWGNLTHRYGWGGEVQGGGAGQSSDLYYYYDTHNRRTGFSYDNAGNLTFDGGQNFTYDATGQQTNASYSGYSLQQSYDCDRLRVEKVENGSTTYYLRSSVLGGQVVAEIIWASVSWQWNRGYVYAGSQLLAVQQGGVNWMHEDPLTKSKRVTNSAGNVVSAIELDPWGADTSRSSNAAFQPKKFTSYERDSNGTDEAMFRRYNRWHSRFDQPDPYNGSYDLTDPQSFNRYSYVENDPVNFVDPIGLEPSVGCGADQSFADCFGSGGGSFWGGGFNMNDRHSMFRSSGQEIINDAEYDHDERYFPENGPFRFHSAFEGLPWFGFLPQDPRPKKEPVLVIMVPKKEPTCVEHEWGVFKRKLEAVTAAAEKHFEERELPWPIKWLQAIASGIGGDDPIDPAKSAEDRLKDSVSDIINIMARNKEIEEGTRREEKARDEAIRRNCKKP